MSRSTRKTPIFGIAATSDKLDKRFANRACRRGAHTALVTHRPVLDGEAFCWACFGSGIDMGLLRPCPRECGTGWPPMILEIKEPPLVRDVSDPWNFAKDGKRYRRKVVPADMRK